MSNLNFNAAEDNHLYGGGIQMESGAYDDYEDFKEEVYTYSENQITHFLDSLTDKEFEALRENASKLADALYDLLEEGR